MYPRLGLRSRILALTMPIVILVSAATAGIIYLSLGQVLEASARDIAASEAAELRTDLTIHTIDDLAQTHEIDIGNRVSQIVDDTGTVVMTTDRSVTTPMIDPTIPVATCASSPSTRCRVSASRVSPWPPPTPSARTDAATPCSWRWRPRSRPPPWAGRRSSR